MSLMRPLSQLSVRAQTLRPSQIREIAELGMKQDGVIPLWFGEGAWPTSPLIVSAAVSALQAENHYYQPNNGVLALRQEICRYSNALLDCDLVPEQITVTPSGMQGLTLAAQVLVTPGDPVVVIEPGWPNIATAFSNAGAQLSSVGLTVREGRWALDVEALLAALTPATKALAINSPNNPTGWTLTAAEQQLILKHCRDHGIWIVADDVYARLYRHGNVAPSFLTLAEPDDLVLSVNSFSKCWAMTGWRLGWLVAPAVLEAKLGQLTEFNTSCTSGFVQAAGVTALRDGEAEVANLLQRIDAGYAIAAARLSAFERVKFIRPDGAFYCFFSVDGLADSLAAAKQILDQTGVGLAPGAAFGEMGEGYLRLCYAQPGEVLEQAFDRLSGFLGNR